MFDVRVLFNVMLCLHFLGVPYVVRADDFQKGREAANAGNFAEAYYYWKPLADKGDARAMFNIGRMFARGDGVRQDFTKAHAFFEAAARHGDSEAAEKLGHMYFYGDGVRRDLEEAKRWYALALKNIGSHNTGEHDPDQVQPELSERSNSPAPYPDERVVERRTPSMEALPERWEIDSASGPHGGELSATSTITRPAPDEGRQAGFEHDLSSGSPRDRDIVVYSDGNPDAGTAACLIAAEQTNRDSARMDKISEKFKEIVGQQVPLPRCTTDLAPYVLVELELVDLTRIVTIDILKQRVMRGELARIETLTID